MSLVTYAAEGRSFCAGYDISPNPARAARRGNALAWHASLTDDATLELTPWNMKKPVIASVQGHCLGGGCELAMVCDLTIAADDALFGEPEIRFSSVGPVMVMPWVIGLKRARELLYLGDPIDAPTALAYGMVNRVVPRAELAEATLKVARRIALMSPEALAATKLAVNRGAECAGFLNAVTLATHDMTRAVRFYRALGFQIEYGGEQAEFTSLAVGQGHLNLMAV